MRADVLELMAEEIGRVRAERPWRVGFHDWNKDADWRLLERLRKQAKDRRYRRRHRAKLLEYHRAYYLANRDTWPKWSPVKRAQSAARRCKARAGKPVRSGCSACGNRGHNRRTCEALS